MLVTVLSPALASNCNVSEGALSSDHSMASMLNGHGTPESYADGPKHYK